MLSLQLFVFSLLLSASFLLLCPVFVSPFLPHQLFSYVIARHSELVNTLAFPVFTREGVGVTGERCLERGLVILHELWECNEVSGLLFDGVMVSRCLLEQPCTLVVDDRQAGVREGEVQYMALMYNDRGEGSQGDFVPTR